MKIIPATTLRATTSYLSPVVVWQTLLARLLEQHYGLNLNDTPFNNEKGDSGTHRRRDHSGQCRQFSGGEVRIGPYRQERI